VHIQVAHVAMLKVPVIAAHQGIDKQRGIIFARVFNPFHLSSIKDRQYKLSLEGIGAAIGTLIGIRALLIRRSAGYCHFTTSTAASG